MFEPFEALYTSHFDGLPCLHAPEYAIAVRLNIPPKLHCSTIFGSSSAANALEEKAQLIKQVPVHSEIYGMAACGTRQT
jgi:hypothetical protein